MQKYIPREYKNPNSDYNGRFYAYPIIEETIDLKAVAEHMSNHNSGFSEAMCIGVLKAMVKCIKELLLDGKNVKIDDLAIFSLGIVNATGGAASAKEFTTSKHIKGVKLRARATGTLSNASLNLSASLRKATVLLNGTIVDEEPITPDEGGENQNPSGGGGDDTVE